MNEVTPDESGAANRRLAWHGPAVPPIALDGRRTCLCRLGLQDRLDAVSIDVRLDVRHDRLFPSALRRWYP